MKWISSLSQSDVGDELEDESTTDELLRRYALGRLSEVEQERIEERIFAEGEFFERLLIVEDELIDAYSTGGLAEDERRDLTGRLVLQAAGLLVELVLPRVLLRRVPEGLAVVAAELGPVDRDDLEPVLAFL